MEVGDAAAGDGVVEVEADVEPVGLDDELQELFCENDGFHQVGAFGGVEAFELGDFAEGDREEVAGVVGERFSIR